MRNSSGVPVGDFLWSQAKVGDLGRITSMSVASDVSWMLCGADVGGGWRRTGGNGGAWTQIINLNSLPSGVTAAQNPGNNTYYGLYDCAISASTPATAYAVWWGFVLKTTDSGATWAATAFAQDTALNSNSSTDRSTSKLAIDPATANAVYVGTEAGLRYTLDGGATWTASTGIPAPTSASYYVRVAVDPTSSLTSGRHSIVYTYSYGNGVYKSTDGGVSFTQISSTITFITTMGCSANGTLWIADKTGAITPNLQNYTTAGGWGAVKGPAGVSISIIGLNPSDATQMLCGYQGGPAVSKDGGATWLVWNANKQQVTTQNVPLISKVLTNDWAGGGSAASQTPAFSSDGRVYAGCGLGVVNWVWSTLPNVVTNPITWVEDSLGMEELVAMSGRVSPNGTAYFSSQDRAVTATTAGSNLYATGWGVTTAFGQNLVVGYSSDYACNNSQWAAASAAYACGYSTNNGQTWTAFAAQPYAIGSNTGALAVGDSGNVVYFGTNDSWPRYTLDNGATWIDCTFTGISKPGSGTTGFGTVSSARRVIVCSDKRNAGTFYAYQYVTGNVSGSGGIWKSTDGGATWAKTASGGIMGGSDPTYHVYLRIGSDGSLWLSYGNISGYFHPSTNPSSAALLMKSTDGGVTWSAVPNICEPDHVDLGAPPPGSTIPTLYVNGWYSSTNSAPWTQGIWVSYDLGATFKATTFAPVWSEPYALAADPTNFGVTYLGQSGGGFQKGVLTDRITCI